MGFKNSMKFIPLSSIDTATFTGSYQVLNSGIPFPLFAFKIVNDSTVGVTVSYDGGITDNDYIPAMSAVIYDLQANKSPQNDFSALPQGTSVQVNFLLGTGLVYFVGLYQPQGA
jgi:hypothetical protein